MEKEIKALKPMIRTEKDIHLEQLVQKAADAVIGVIRDESMSWEDLRVFYATLIHKFAGFLMDR